MSTHGIDEGLYDVIDVCRHVINYSNDANYGISSLKLQKMLYFLQAYFLITGDHSPCFRERIEAWDFGPVVPEAYRKYKHYGCGDIPRINSYAVFDEDNLWCSSINIFKDDIIARKDKRRMDAVVDKFADYSATNMFQLICGQSPWIDVYQKDKHNEISIQSLREYFTTEESHASRVPFL